ncbi:hypothetical protein JLK41_16605 [Ectopseudomonas khazarica]|uniref:hypothetical protein n=1 Tax=Ectopseudomonas khazarica TaxID=2502979 RepID=UPI001AEFFBA9|nr:hypothetical protein [Pseudomonas khazarica]QTS84936.1 hypothetical protein JLK41_16605 [Pseudomonas khazarica]
MTNKTTISGAPREYSQAELAQLQEQRKTLYQHAENYIHVQADLSYDFLMAVIEKEKEGFVLCPKAHINMVPLAFRARMIKPEEVQEAELAVVYEQVKEDYIEALKKERAEYKKLLVLQLEEAEMEKERKRQEQAKAKKLADFQQQAEECFGELIIPE